MLFHLPASQASTFSSDTKAIFIKTKNNNGSPGALTSRLYQESFLYAGTLQPATYLSGINTKGYNFGNKISVDVALDPN